MEDNNFKHMEQLEYISLQLKAFYYTLNALESQYEVQQIGEDVTSSYTILKHSINDIREEVKAMINEILESEEKSKNKQNS